MTTFPSKAKEDALDGEAFESLLAWLDPDRERAGNKYEEIRSRLIRIFNWRGCQFAEDLADETINRVAKKVPEVAGTYEGDPALYFYGVARNVFRESVRARPDLMPPPQPKSPQEKEREHECLDRCMKQLPKDNRKLILEYYREEKQGKIDLRKELAERWKIPINALRIRVHRIKATLQDCLTQCLQEKPCNESALGSIII